MKLNKTGLLLLLSLLILVGCISNSKKNEMDVNYKEIGNDEAFILYKKALDNFRENNSFSMTMDFISYNEKNHNEIYGNSKFKYKANNYGTLDCSANITAESNVLGAPQEFYYLNQKMYLKSEKQERHMLNYDQLMYENFIFLNLLKDDIKNAEFGRNEVESFLSVTLVLDPRKKKEFFGEDTVGSVYNVKGNEIKLFYIIENDVFKNVTFEYTISSPDNIDYTIETNIIFDEYANQKLTFPSGFEEWEDYDGKIKW